MKHFFLILAFFLVATAGGYSQQTIKILAIGNSFSEDAVEDYLDDLARAAGVNVIIGNAVIGGCPLQKHWNNAAGDSANYSYRFINEKGEKTVTARRSLLSCITDEDWDYITLQQHSGSAGRIETYFPYLTRLVGYIKGHATNPRVKLAFHQTWAYAQDSKHAMFPYYGKDQNVMYRAIVETVRDAAARAGITLVIPTGTAIQNARLNMHRDDFCRDGYHLDKTIGRYTAACAWFEALLGKTVAGNPFHPEAISPEEALAMQLSARYALMQPNATTRFR